LAVFIYDIYDEYLWRVAFWSSHQMSAHFFDFKGEMLSLLGEDRCHCSRMPWGDSETAKFGGFFSLQ